MIGIKGSETFNVTENLTAKNVGSGDVEVLSTPVLVSFVEKTCRESIKEKLEEGKTTVGTNINLDHLAPTPVGVSVVVKSEVVEVNNRLIRFEFTVDDNVDRIARGSHTRFIVDIDKFQEKADRKKD